jgi:hypothetical protein
MLKVTSSAVMTDGRDAAAKRHRFRLAKRLAWVSQHASLLSRNSEPRRKLAIKLRYRQAATIRIPGHHQRQYCASEASPKSARLPLTKIL